MNKAKLEALLTPKKGEVATLARKFPERIHPFKYVIFFGPFSDAEVNAALVENGHCPNPETPEATRYRDGNYYVVIDARRIGAHRKEIMQRVEQFLLKAKTNQ